MIALASSGLDLNHVNWPGAVTIIGVAICVAAVLIALFKYMD